MDEALANALADALRAADVRDEPDEARRSQISAEPGPGGGYEVVIRKRSGRVVTVDLDGAIEWRSEAEYDERSVVYGNSVSFSAEATGE